MKRSLMMVWSGLSNKLSHADARVPSARLVLLLLILGAGARAAAQNTATLSGVVTDPQGASVKAAKDPDQQKHRGRANSSGE